MATFCQLSRRKRSKNLRKYNRSPKMEGCPQKVGVCLKVGTTKPKKPNSAVRKIVKVGLRTGKRIRAAIPGAGHSIAEYSTIWIEAKRARDIPGIHYRVIRGKGDVEIPEVIRYNRRSKFSIPNWVVRVIDRDENSKVTYIAHKIRAFRHLLEEENGLPLTWNTNRYYLSRAIKKKKTT